MISHGTKVSGIILFSALAGSVALTGLLAYLINYSQAKLADEQVALAEAQMHQQELAALSTLVTESEEERAKLASHLLDDDGTIEFLALLEEIGREQGIEIDLNISTDELNATFETLTITLAMEGPYNTVVHVLKMLETLPVQSEVTTVGLSRLENTEEGILDMWEALIELQVIKRKSVL